MGAVRHARTIKLGVAVIVGLLMLVGTPALLGVARGKDNRAAAGRAAAVPRPQPAVRAGSIPFTRVDIFLLASGGAMLLLLGSAIGRARDEPFVVTEVEVDGDA
jgi:hypothetical protein